MSVETRRAAIDAIESNKGYHQSDIDKINREAIKVIREEFESLAALAAESEMLRELLLAKSRELALEQAKVAALETQPRHGTPLLEHLNTLFVALTGDAPVRPGENVAINLRFENTGYGWIMVGNGEPEMPKIPKIPEIPTVRSYKK